MIQFTILLKLYSRYLIGLPAMQMAVYICKTGLAEQLYLKSVSCRYQFASSSLCQNSDTVRNVRVHIIHMYHAQYCTV